MGDSDQKRLGDLDLDILDRVADKLIASDIGANNTWGRGFKMVLQEIRDTRQLFNSPRIDEFIEAVRIEAAHQVERWGTPHDGGKRNEDWLALMLYLLGKATKSQYHGDMDKLKHHVITTAAACLNWFRALSGGDNRMRPGIDR